MSVKIHFPARDRRREKMKKIIRSHPKREYIQIYIRKTNRYSYCSLVSNNQMIISFTTMRILNAKTMSKIEQAKVIGQQMGDLIVDRYPKKIIMYDLNGCRNHGRVAVIINEIRSKTMDIIASTKLSQKNLNIKKDKII